MTWDITLLKPAGWGLDKRGRSVRQYECRLCKNLVTSSQRAEHGRKHEFAGEAVRWDSTKRWAPRGRLEWDIKTDDPALETEYPRYHRVPKEPTVESLIKVGA